MFDVYSLKNYVHLNNSHLVGYETDDGHIIHYHSKHEMSMLRYYMESNSVGNAFLDDHGHVHLRNPSYVSYQVKESEEKAVSSYFPQEFYQYEEKDGLLCCSLTAEARVWLEQTPLVPHYATLPPPLLHYNGEVVTSFSRLLENISMGETLDVSALNSYHIEDMSFLFHRFRRHSQEPCLYMTPHTVELIGLEKLDTKKVTNMERMFESAYMGKLDLSTMDTSSVEKAIYFWNNAVLPGFKEKDVDFKTPNNLGRIYVPHW